MKKNLSDHCKINIVDLLIVIFIGNIAYILLLIIDYNFILKIENNFSLIITNRKYTSILAYIYISFLIISLILIQKKLIDDIVGIVLCVINIIFIVVNKEWAVSIGLLLSIYFITYISLKLYKHCSDLYVNINEVNDKKINFIIAVIGLIIGILIGKL